MNSKREYFLGDTNKKLGKLRKVLNKTLIKVTKSEK